MAISRGEFLRLLPLASEARSIEETPLGWRLALAAGEVSIRFDELPGLRIGSLALPRARVTLEFPSAVDWSAAFLQRFDLYYRRGGG